MDSAFHPTVEMVLVADVNDIEDPLNSLDADDDISPMELELNDTVESDDEFQLSILEPKIEIDEQKQDSPSAEMISDDSMSSMGHLHFSNDDEESFDENSTETEVTQVETTNTPKVRQKKEDIESHIIIHLIRKQKEVDAPSKVVPRNSRKCKKTPVEIAENEATVNIEKSEQSPKKRKKAEMTPKSEKSSAKRRKFKKALAEDGESKKTSILPEESVSKGRERKKTSIRAEKSTEKKAKSKKAPVSFHCRICDSDFDNSPVFTQHMRSEHQIEKPFVCAVCDKAYRIHSLLVEHHRSHTGEKPYHCEQCDRRFLQLQPYKAHMRWVSSSRIL